MKKGLNILFFILILIFFFSTYKYYSSNMNIETKNYIRDNIDKIIDEKVLNLPVLSNNTDNVIEFNDGLTNKRNNDKPRSFWNLLKSK